MRAEPARGRRKKCLSSARSSFESEAEMVRTLWAILNETMVADSEGDVHFAAELPVGRCIVDLVCAIYESGQTPPHRPLSVRESVVMSRLRRDGPTRVDLLERACGLGQRALRDDKVAHLFESQLLRRMPGGVLGIGEGWPSPMLVAIEAKLFNWKGGIEQALSYASYADRVYLALPSDIQRLSAIASACSDRGVGLLLVGKHGVEKSVDATERVEHDWRREFAMSRLG